MLFLVLASAFLVAVHGQDADPTKVCLPDVLQVDIASLTRNMTGILAADFPKKLIAYRYSDGTRHVVNLTEASIASINEADGSCQEITSEFVKDLDSQCLPGILQIQDFGGTVTLLPSRGPDGIINLSPFSVVKAGAKLITDIETVLGLNPGGLEIEAWQQDLPNIGTFRIAVTKSSPNVPVVAQVISSDPIYSDIQIFLNPQTTIDDTDIFKVPDVCPPASIVG